MAGDRQITDDDVSSWATATTADFATGVLDAGLRPGVHRRRGHADADLEVRVHRIDDARGLDAEHQGGRRRNRRQRRADTRLRVDYRHHDLHGATRRGVVATFSGAINQVAGWNNAQFITKADGILYARTVNNAGQVQLALGTGLFGAPTGSRSGGRTAACSTKSTHPGPRITASTISTMWRCSSATCRQWAAARSCRLDSRLGRIGDGHLHVARLRRRQPVQWLNASATAAVPAARRW